MKLLAKVLVVVLVMSGAAFADIKQDLMKSLNTNLANRGISGIKIDVEVLEKLDNPKGYAFVKVILNRQGQIEEQYLITDGKNALPDIITLAGNESTKNMLTFKHTPSADIDTKGLSLMDGNPNAKNKIVKVSDFQCPFCVRAYQYLHQVLQTRDDIGVYLINMPLPNHEKADLFARIFESGVQMGENFVGQLYLDKKLPNMADDAIIAEFAKQTNNPARFTSLVKSPEMIARINAQSKLAASLNVQATPALFFNGKKVDGFNQPLINNALEQMSK